MTEECKKEVRELHNTKKLLIAELNNLRGQNEPIKVAKKRKLIDFANYKIQRYFATSTIKK